MRVSHFFVLYLLLGIFKDILYNLHISMSNIFIINLFYFPVSTVAFELLKVSTGDPRIICKTVFIPGIK